MIATNCRVALNGGRLAGLRRDEISRCEQISVERSNLRRPTGHALDHPLTAEEGSGWTSPTHGKVKKTPKAGTRRQLLSQLVVQRLTDHDASRDVVEYTPDAEGPPTATAN